MQRANEIRSARAKLKQDLASGKLDLAGIVADPPEWVMSARVRDLWLALPRIGPVKAGRILAQCGIAHSKTLGGVPYWGWRFGARVYAWLRRSA